MESGLSWWNMRRKAIAQLNDEIATNNRASDSTCGEECTGNSVVVPCAIPVSDLILHLVAVKVVKCEIMSLHLKVV